MRVGGLIKIVTMSLEAIQRKRYKIFSHFNVSQTVQLNSDQIQIIGMCHLCFPFRSDSNYCFIYTYLNPLQTIYSHSLNIPQQICSTFECQYYSEQHWWCLSSCSPRCIYILSTSTTTSDNYQMPTWCHWHWFTNTPVAMITLLMT